MESNIFEQERIAHQDDVDVLGHVNNIVYVRWVQEVAIAHSDLAGLDFAAYQKEGAVFVVRRHEVEYLRPAYEGEPILLRTWIAEWKGASAWRETRIVRQSDGQDLVQARTLWVYVDVKTGRPKRVPRTILDGFKRTPPS